MKKAIIFSSATDNTKKLAQAIYDNLEDVIYCGKPSEEALEADLIFVGSWTKGATCIPDIKECLGAITNKKLFLFMTAGYGSTEEFFAPIINSMKEAVNDTNKVVGTFICQGKVSDAKQAAIKKTDEAKYEAMKSELDNSTTHPDEADIAKLVAMIKAL